MMILRLSEKLRTKIKAGKLSEKPLDENLYADWSAHLFVVDRTQYIILSNTASMYSCVMYGTGINHDSRLIQRAFSAIREFMEADGLSHRFRRSVLIWLLLIAAEIIHGILRAIALVPLLGEFRSNQIGVFTGSAIILVIASLTIRWIGTTQRSAMISAFR
jgi:hypothetical protein